MPKKRRGYGFGYKPPLATPPPPPPAGPFLVDEVANDTLLAGHTAVKWYPSLTSWAAVEPDMTWEQGFYGYNPNRWPKVAFTTAPEFVGNIPAMRFESTSPADGADQQWIISAWTKFLNHTTRGSIFGSAMQTGPVTECWFRYCIKWEADVWAGHKELGIKVLGVSSMQDDQGLGGEDRTSWHGGLQPLWPGAHNNPPTAPYSPPYNTATDTLYWINYFWGLDQFDGEHQTLSNPPLAITPGAWHTVEQHCRMNTVQADGSANPDGIFEVWIDDVLIWNYQNVRMRHFRHWNGGGAPSADNPNGIYPPEIWAIYGFIWHGGLTHPPAARIHFGVTGLCIADRRIGAPKRV